MYIHTYIFTDAIHDHIHIRKRNAQGAPCVASLRAPHMCAHTFINAYVYIYKYIHKYTYSHTYLHSHVKQLNICTNTKRTRTHTHTKETNRVRRCTSPSSMVLIFMRIHMFIYRCTYTHIILICIHLYVQILKTYNTLEWNTRASTHVRSRNAHGAPCVAKLRASHT